MNKYKKLAAAAVSVVLAGSMILPLAACGGNNNSTRRKKKEVNVDWSVKPTLEAGYTPSVDDNDNLKYTKVDLSMNVGNQNSTAPQSIAYRSVELSGSVTMPDGKSYSVGDLKPAWAALSAQLNITFTDNFANLSSESQITTPNSTNELNKYDIITGSLDAINKNADKFLNLSDYMYYMPNYQAFLKANEVTLFSLTGDTDGGMYAAPYFDGNDDIEKYDMVKREWVRTILDSGDLTKATTTFAQQAAAKTSQSAVGTAASVESYMGTTGSWTVETTSLTDDTKTTTVKVNYDAALTAAKDSSSALGSALAACGVTAANLTSGNIVDLQNAAINATNGAVTGGQLAAILRAYIDVAYTTTGNAKFYTTRSDVFNSASGAWDVDLLVAMMRCVVTGINLFDSATISKGIGSLFGLSGRQETTQRTVDLYALAGELYGIRGLESRFEYTYFDKDGNLLDNRQDPETYELLSRMGALADEGLLYVINTGATSKGTAPASGKTSYADSGSLQSFMLHDYVQTQTSAYFTAADKLPEGYDFAPIVTPVSKWDEDSNGTHETIMRFTESWRSVKNTAFCVPKASVANNPNKLSAILAFIDYLFSADGQILMTYGARSTTGNTNPDGWWYATESNLSLNTVAEKTTDETSYAPAQYTVKDEYVKQVFVYQGKVYEGMPYASRNIPKMTDANTTFYTGGAVNGVKQYQGNVLVNAVGDYTNYARKIIGTTLPIGNKDQGFEYQTTAPCGLDGAAKVAAAINNETIKHVKLSLYEDESMWYLITPTAVPYTAADRATLTNNVQTNISGMYFYNSSSTNYYTNVYTDLVFFGFDTTHNICGYENNGAMKTNGSEYVVMLNNNGLTTRVAIMKDGWDTLYRLYY